MATLKALCENALYKSINDRQFDPLEPGGNEINVAFDLLLNILDEVRDTIPFTETVSFSTYEELTSTPFVSVVNVEYLLGDVIFTLKSRTRTQFLNESIVPGLRSVPQIYWFDQLNQTVQVYPQPSEPANGFVVTGFSGYENLTLNSPIPTNMPRFLRSYLEYELASRLCNEYGVEWSEQKELTRQKLDTKASNLQEIDLTPPAKNDFRRPGTGSYGFPWWYWLSKGSA